MIDDIDIRLCVVGLGYVGLPLAAEFSRHMPVTGFDINQIRIDELNRGIDRSNEVATSDLKTIQNLIVTSDVNNLGECNVYIITVPTPVDDHKQPDLSPLVNASRQISGLLNTGDIVIYESTVFPGATEEICVPELEQGSGLVYNKDFFVGYSPERINPGDKKHTLTNTVKVTAGSNPDTATFVDGLYGKIITAGTFKASSIAVAEAAKVIEN
ncbi:nucleotide sugar dehydrogenase, partial [Candidatus Pacearchaeota archaeon]|nr:nucleotide sugar dehydrogenase [Candidatus Pacearchaeota archaeon]